MDAIILCGGKGTRLASVVSDVPKPLAEVEGRPFLDYVLNYLVRSGQVSRFVLATGHLAHKVEAHYGVAYAGIPIVYSEEQNPLGTGGAVVLALRQCEISPLFFVLNGDSFQDADLGRMRTYLESGRAAGTLALQRVNDAARFGTVSLDGQRVTGFREKTGQAVCGLINAGIYLLRRAALDDWAHRTDALSLETEVFPALAAQGRLAGLECGSRFIDIGLPETYRLATRFFSGAV